MANVFEKIFCLIFINLNANIHSTAKNSSQISFIYTESQIIYIKDDLPKYFTPLEQKHRMEEKIIYAGKRKFWSDQMSMVFSMIKIYRIHSYKLVNYISNEAYL